MPYKNKIHQAESSNRHYHRNKGKIIKKNILRKKNTAKFIQSLKNKPCLDCGVHYPPHVMDFDHISGEKVSNVASMIYFSSEKILEEIAKCELVCSNCHRIRTFNRKMVS